MFPICFISFRFVSFCFSFVSSKFHRGGKHVLIFEMEILLYVFTKFLPFWWIFHIFLAWNEYNQMIKQNLNTAAIFSSEYCEVYMILMSILPALTGYIHQPINPLCFVRALYTCVCLCVWVSNFKIYFWKMVQLGFVLSCPKWQLTEKLETLGFSRWLTEKWEWEKKRTTTVV